MKLLLKLTLAFILFACSINIIYAQNAKADRKAAKKERIKQLIESQNFVLEANYVEPQRGASRALTSQYDLTVTKDTVIAFLPYFGRAYVAPQDLYPTDGGVKFTWTDYNYVVKQKKNGSWEISIRPKTTHINRMDDVQQVILRVGSEGYSSLQISSTNRDQISFDGTIEEIIKKK